MTRTPILLPLLAALSCLLATIAHAQTAAPVWVDFEEKDDIAYLLRRSPAQVMRYDLAAESWLTPLTLTEIPDHFAVADAHIFLSYGRKIERIDLDGGGKTFVKNFGSDVTAMEVTADELVMATGGSYPSSPNLVVLDAATFAQLGTASHYYALRDGTSIAPASKVIYGRRYSSPSDVIAADFSNPATITFKETPYHGDYTIGLETFVFPDETKVTDSSGTIYSAGDLTYNNSFGVALDDLAFHGSDVPVVLSGDQLIGYSNVILETGRHTLAKAGRNLTVRGGRIAVFHEDGALPTKVGVELVDLADLNPATPGAPVSPVGLSYEVSATAVDGGGMVHLLSKSFASVFRWDPATQKYSNTIPLPEPAELMVYSETLDRLYVYAPSRKVYRIDLASPEPAAVHHLTVPLRCDKMIPLESDLMILRNGSWEDQWIYDENGALLKTPVSCCYNDFHFYHAPSHRLFYESRSVEYLGEGLFAAPIYSAPGGVHLAISSDGQLLVNAEGLIHSASDHSQLDALSNQIVAAVWNGSDQLFTLKKPATTGPSYDPVYEQVTTLQRWSEYYSIEDEIRIEGSFRELRMSGDRLLVVTSVAGVPSLTLLDPDFDIVAPPEIEAPQLSLESFSATAAALAWSDVGGEEAYVIERSDDGGASWAKAGEVPLSTHNFTDVTLVAGNHYLFRVTAVNDLVESPASNVIEVDLGAVVDSRVDPRTVTVTVDDALITGGDVVYLFSKNHRSIFTWDAATQDWGKTIPLRDAPVLITWSAENNAIYTAYDDAIFSIGLAAANPVEIPFAELPGGQISGLVAAGRFVVAYDNAPGQRFYHSYDPAGHLIATKSYYYQLSGAVWNGANRRIYHLRDGTSPNDLLAAEVIADGTFGTHIDSPAHSSIGIKHPVRVAPDGSIVILGSGRIYHPTSLAQIDDLSADHLDAAFPGGRLVTLRDDRIFSHDPLTYAATQEIVLPAGGKRLLATSDGGLVVLSTTSSGGVALDRYDAAFTPLLPTVLAKPTLVTAAPAGAASIDLVWSDVSGETDYRLERRTGQTWTVIATPGVNVTAFTDSAVPLGATYEYRVTATRGTLSSQPSDPLQVVFMVPAAPIELTAEALDAARIRLSWADVDYEGGYRVELRIDPSSGWTLAAETPADMTTVEVAGLSQNTTYEFRVRASNGIGDSAWTTATATTDALPPEPPSSLDAGASATQVDLTWLPGLHAAEYRIERKTWAGPWELLTSVSTTSFIDLAVSPETSYIYRVSSANPAGVSLPSPEKNVTTPALPPPATPARFEAMTQTSTSILLTWTPGAGAQDHLIQRRSGETGWANLALVSGGSTSFVDLGLVEGTEYCYRIAATNASGVSPFTAEACARPLDLICLVQTDFASGTSADWFEISGGVVIRDGGPTFPGGDALWFGRSGERSLTTGPLDVSGGGIIRFSARGGNQARDGSEFWEDPDVGDDILVQYSHDGAAWTTLRVIDASPHSFGDWNDFALAVPTEALGPAVSFRWIQSNHSGAGSDHWAIDHLCILTPRPPLPPPPAFVIAASNTPDTVSLFWSEVPGAFSYRIERTEPGGAWATVAEIPSTLHFFTDENLTPASPYAYRLSATSVAGTSAPTRTHYVTTLSQLDAWLDFHDPDGRFMPRDARLEAENPHGVSLLERYAYGLGPDARRDELPKIFFDSVRQRLCVDLTRRREDLNPEVRYIFETCSRMGDWQAVPGAVSRITIDGEWESVDLEDTLGTADSPHRFARLRLVPQPR